MVSKPWRVLAVTAPRRSLAKSHDHGSGFGPAAWGAPLRPPASVLKPPTIVRVPVAGPPRFEPRAVSRPHGFSARGRSGAATGRPRPVVGDDRYEIVVINH